MEEKTVIIKGQSHNILGQSEKRNADLMLNMSHAPFINANAYKDSGFEKIVVYDGENDGISDDRRKVGFFGMELSGGERISQDNLYFYYTIYKTKGDKFLLYIRENEVGTDSERFLYYICNTLEEIDQEHQVPASVLNAAKEALGLDPVIMLDM